jgi:hypothetical protein
MMLLYHFLISSSFTVSPGGMKTGWPYNKTLDFAVIAELAMKSEVILL